MNTSATVKDDGNEHRNVLLQLQVPANDEGSAISNRANWGSEESKETIDEEGEDLSGVWHCWQEITCNKRTGTYSLD